MWTICLDCCRPVPSKTGQKKPVQVAVQTGNYRLRLSGLGLLKVCLDSPSLLRGIDATKHALAPRVKPIVEKKWLHGCVYFICNKVNLGLAAVNFGARFEGMNNAKTLDQLIDEETAARIALVKVADSYGIMTAAFIDGEFVLCSVYDINEEMAQALEMAVV